MNKEIATFCAVLDDLSVRPARCPLIIDAEHFQCTSSDSLPYLKTPKEFCVHRIKNLDHGYGKSVLMDSSIDTNYAFDELTALQGSKTFVDWKQYHLYGRASLAKYKEFCFPTVERIQSIETIFSLSPLQHIILHHDFSEFYVSEFWTGETFVNAALDYYQIPSNELVRVDWKTDSIKSFTFVLTLIKHSLVEPRVRALRSFNPILISHYDYVRSTSLEEYKVCHFCPLLSPDNFGFLLLTLTQLTDERPLEALLNQLSSLLEPFDVLKIYLFRNASPSLITFALVFDFVLSCQEAYMKLNNVNILDYKITTRFPVMDLIACSNAPVSLIDYKEMSLNAFDSPKLERQILVNSEDTSDPHMLLPSFDGLDFDRAHTPFSLDVSRIHTADPTPLSSPVFLSTECPICGHFHERFISETNSSPSSPLSTLSNEQPYRTLLTNQIIPWRIQAGLDSRTTCMLRNIPNKYTQAMLIDYVNESHYGLYDFLYLRMDFKNKCNVGYAFINFIDARTVICFSKRVKGAKWQMFNTCKIADLTYANIQGIDALIRKFRNSSVMDAPLEYRPKLFIVKGDRTGKELPFPLPDKIRRQM